MCSYKKTPWFHLAGWEAKGEKAMGRGTLRLLCCAGPDGAGGQAGQREEQEAPGEDQGQGRRQVMGKWCIKW